MNTYQAEASAVIDAPPANVYAILADYHEKHPAILPSRYFTDIQVTQGGQGAGTLATVRMNVYGTKTLYNMIVSEPEPGRVLQEEDAAAGVVTTFTVDPIDRGTHSRVTIAVATAVAAFRSWRLAG